MELAPAAAMKGEPIVGVKAPSDAILKTPTMVRRFAFASPAKRRLLLQFMSTPAAAPKPPSPNGEPWTRVSDPSGAMPNIATLPNRPAARNLPFGDTFIPMGLPPAKKGEPGTAVSEPSAPMLKDVILPDGALPAIKNCPSGVTAKEIPKSKPLLGLELSNGNGDPGTGVRFPLLGSMEKALTSLVTLLEA